MKFQFDHSTLQNFKESVLKEWAMTNGIGGYAGSSIIGAHNRTHQGYLIASLHPPVERFLVFSKTNECIAQAGKIYNLETAQHAGAQEQEALVDSAEVPDAYKRADTVHVASDFVPREPIYTQGNQYQTSFIYDGTVHFAYEAGQVEMHKHIALTQGKNQVAIAYEIINHGEEAELTITPLMNYREHNQNSTPESLKFKEELGQDQDMSPLGFALIPEKQPDLFIWLGVSQGEILRRQKLYDEDMQLQTEVINETPGLDCHYTPYDIKVSIPKETSVKLSVLCHIGKVGQDTYTKVEDDTAFLCMEKQMEYLNQLVKKADYGEDDFANALVLASNQFLSYRESTGLMTVLAGLPWFTDWGRDTMIAFSGLTLSTKRYEEARQILLTFAKYIHHGMVPNMFPDDGLEPLYNTVDASLWYFYAVDQYLNYVNTKEAYDFIEKEIYPALKEIMAAYQNGTDFSIYMEEDGLIHAGSGVDQVTWMDVRVGDWVVTPRHGKPVEINALWYNALCVMDKLSKQFGEKDDSYSKLSEKVKESFCREFWNPEGGYLYDVVDQEEKDDSLRPNQIYAVSLPYTMLDQEKAKAVVDTVLEKLYAERGIRSLSQDHKDYHPIYVGSLPKRDAAYHQGTAWGFLMGGFISAYLKVNNHSQEALQKAIQYLAPVKEHFYDGCIGSISEIFDGDAPHIGRGCYAQAWSVGEVLRCYTEDILPYL